MVRRSCGSRLSPEVLAKVVKVGEWNDYRIRCEGPRIRLWLNGVKTADYTEPDEKIEQTGLIGMIGKAERGPIAIESIARHKATYLMAVGGAAYLVSKAIRDARVVAFEDLGMEAIYEFDVVDMPVTVAVDTQGSSVHQTGPKEWAAKILAKEVG